MTPTAVFEPVRLCGTSVSRATLHNQDFIDDLDVGIGDTIVVYKSGEVIPKVKKSARKKTDGWKRFMIPMSVRSAVQRRNVKKILRISSVFHQTARRS
ncbi:MAG: hypothetical protein ACLVCH_11780 [Roseburia inulinivorans]